MDDIHVIRPNKGVNLALSMEELLSADPKLNVAIEEGDILYVPRSGVAKVGYIVQQMNPFGYLFLIKAFAFP